jgi:hypothetical protein
MMTRSICVLCLLALLSACGGSDSDPVGPITVPDLAGVWYTTPNWLDWPGGTCTGELIGYCSSTRVTIQQTGAQVTGTIECFALGTSTTFTGTLNSSTGGTITETGCSGGDCWDRTVRLDLQGSGALIWQPLAANWTTGFIGSCTYWGSAIAYPQATSVPVVAGLYEYTVQQGSGPCATCGDSWVNFFYISQDEDQLTLVLNDATIGLVKYDATIDGTGSGSYAVDTVEHRPCPEYVDAGTFAFSGGQIDVVGQSGCPTCLCDYTAVGIPR